MITAVSHVTLFVEDQDKALAFYTNVLGFELHTDAMFGPDMRWLTINAKGQENFEIALMKATTPEEKALVGKQAHEHPFLCLATNDCHGDYERLTKAGVTFIEAPQEQPWGIQAIFKDLYGTTFVLVQAK